MTKLTKTLGRREVVAGVAGFGALVAARGMAVAQPKPAEPGKPAEAGKHPAGKVPAGPAGAHEHAKDAPPAPPLSPTLAKMIETTAACERDGRVCLARCTDHMAAGVPMMADCQRAVMNMLAVTHAMAEVAGYRSASPKHIKALAAVCAELCRACAKSCEPHAEHHEECKACMKACLECAKACDAYTA
jgi:Cys-rich four helix bundle protein (predicted Tat secretion target)